MMHEASNPVYRKRLLMHRVGIALSVLAMAFGVFFLLWILVTLVINGFGAYISSVIEYHDDSVRVHTHGVPDRINQSASRARQLELCGLTPEGIAHRVSAMLESEAMAG